MSVAIADARTLFNEMYMIEELTSTQFERWLARAVRYYSRYNPVLVHEDLTTEVGERTYELPDDCMLVKSIMYVPDPAANEMSMESESLHRKRGVSSNRPSELLIKQVYDQTGLTMPEEVWEVEGANVVFEDGFAAIETLDIAYYALHVLDEEEEAYETIPAQDIDILVDLVMADILGHRAANMGATEDYDEGLEHIIVSKIVSNTAISVERLRSELIRRYGTTAVVKV